MFIILDTIIFYTHPESAHENLVRRVLVMQQRPMEQSFRKVSNFNQFKALISNWNGGDFKCNMCRWLSMGCLLHC